MVFEARPTRPLVPHARIESLRINALSVMRDPLCCEVAREEVPRLERDVGRAERVLPEKAEAMLGVMQVVALEDVDLREDGAQTAEAVLLVRDSHS